MDLTVPALASELMRHMGVGLPDDGLVSGRYVVRTRISSHREIALCSDACELLEERLKEKYLGWVVQVDSFHGDDLEVVVGLSR